MTQVLAKRPYAGHAYTLAEHGEGAANALRVLFDLGVLADIGRMLGLTDLARGYKLATAAALAHDIGKVSARFQAILRANGPQKPAPFAHEHVSLFYLEALRPHVTARVQRLDYDLILAGVGSHHLRLEPRDLTGFCPHPDSDADTYDFGHDDVQTLAQRFYAALSIAEVPPGLPRTTATERDLLRVQSALREAEIRIQRETRRSRGLQALRAFVVVAVILADSLDSARVRVGTRTEALPVWVKALLRGASATPLVRAMAQAQLRGQAVTALQGAAQEAGRRHRRVCILGGCGSGKTAAAYLAAAEQLGTFERSRLFVLAPTRAIATEQFGATAHAVDDPSAVAHEHSGARYQYESMLSSPDETLREQARWAPDPRLFALNLWRYSVIHATFDQVISFVAPQYKGVCLAPLLASGVLMVDEVHAMNARAWSLLRLLIERTDIPVVLLTATLPPQRREDLERLGVVFVEDEAAEAHNRLRYNVHSCSSDDAKRAAIEAYAAGKRVLWVTNTVSRCRQRTIDLRHSGVPALIYHARYLPADRQAHHSKATTAFAFDATAPSVLVATQTCEMSLNLDADVLITEVCPPSSLVQRLGRCCRNPASPLERRGEVYVYTPLSAEDKPLVAPYALEEIEAGRAFVAGIEGRTASQADLAMELAAVDLRESQYRDVARLWTGGICTPKASVREDGYSVRAILPEHLEEAVTRRQQGRTLDDLLLQIPWTDKLERASTDLPEDIRLATGTYCADLGYGA